MDTKHTYLSSVLARLRAYKHIELQAIAAGARVPEGTVRKLYYGEVTNPRINTVEALHAYFESLPSKVDHV